MIRPTGRISSMPPSSTTRTARKILWSASLAWALAAPAPVLPQVLPQVPLPQVRTPGVQLPDLPGEPALRGVGETLRTLSSRATRSRQLFDQHRAELDRD